MKVVGDRFDFVVGIWVERIARLTFITATLDHVEEMRDHARFDLALAKFVKVNSPRIACAFGKKFEDVASGMITPDAGVDACAFALGRAGLADVRKCEDAMTAIEPSVGSPRECVQRFVRVLIRKTVA